MAEFTKRSALPKWVPPWHPNVVTARMRQVLSDEADDISDTNTPRRTQQKNEATYAAGCHCGHLALEVTLSPPLEKGYLCCSCNCSVCTRLGYLLVYPHRNQVKWRQSSQHQQNQQNQQKHDGTSDRDKTSAYRFNTKTIDHLFCPHCGTSMGVDFRGAFLPAYDGYGLNVRTFKDIDIESLSIGGSDGRNELPPAGDASGKWCPETEEE